MKNREKSILIVLITMYALIIALALIAVWLAHKSTALLLFGLSAFLLGVLAVKLYETVRGKI